MYHLLLQFNTRIQMNKSIHFIYDILLKAGITETSAQYLNMIALLVIALIIIFVIDYIVRKVLRNLASRVSIKTRTNFDDILITNKVPRNIAHIVPISIALNLLPIVFSDFQYLENIAEKSIQVFGIILILWIVRSILNTLKDYFKTLPRLKDKPIDSYIQVFMIIAWVSGLMFAFAIISGISIWKFLTTLGAASAVIILVFRDTIMGFVASIQVSVNDMVRIGDWITFEKYGADGDVTEITLATVKVQNFDNTITTIPTYALISDSFKNWRGMTNSDGRRIKRAMNIKMNSIKFLADNEIIKLKDIQLISEYLEMRQEKIKSYNLENTIDKKVLLNGKNLTNIGVFRKYAEEYINNHSAINKEMMIMVRQLAPTTQGLPIEIYAFSADKRWENYEYVMADIFDHLLAAVLYFDLELFELPNNSSFKN